MRKILNQIIKQILAKMKNCIFIAKLILRNTMLIVKNLRKIFVKNVNAVMLLKALEVNMIIILVILKLKNYYLLIKKPKM